MSWLQLRIDLDTDNTDLEAWEDAVLAAGAVSVTLQDNADQPILEPALGTTPVWQQTRLLALFTADCDQDLALVIITAQMAQAPPHWQWDIVEDQVWERAWMDNFQPRQYGERLWVCPSWSTPPAADAVNLMLDPGLAFGTGTHATTALCLQWLDQQPLTGKRVLDYGCGSGILGIAALLLGADSVVAVDNDPQALLASRENARRNGIDEHRLHTCLPQQLADDYRADVLVANILAGPLMELAATLAQHCQPGAATALSGLLNEQAEALQQHYQTWFALDQTASEGDWSRVSGQRLRD